MAPSGDAASCCCSALGAVYRTVPVGGIAAFTVTAIGLSLAGSSRATASRGLSDLGVEVDGVEDILTLAALPWTITHLFNVVGLVLCLLSAGVIREFLFQQSSSWPWAKWCMGFCLQRCVLTVVVWSLWLAFLVGLLLSHATFLLSILMAVASTACESGVDAAQKLLDLANELEHLLHPFRKDQSSPKDISQAKELCGSVGAFASAGLRLFAGSLVAVVGQAAMLANLYRGGERMATERAREEEGAVAAREVRRDDVQLASVSSSGNMAEPLAA